MLPTSTPRPEYHDRWTKSRFQDDRVHTFTFPTVHFLNMYHPLSHHVFQDWEWGNTFFANLPGTKIVAPYVHSNTIRLNPQNGKNTFNGKNHAHLKPLHFGWTCVCPTKEVLTFISQHFGWIDCWSMWKTSCQTRMLRITNTAWH
jgi:hypothetical protein